jgi:ABC-type nickel/cobalt efflux system permease component RcnA
MNQWFTSLAALKIGEGILDTKTMSFVTREVGLVLFGVVTLAVALTVWVGFIRKRKRVGYSSTRRRHHHHHRDHHHDKPEEAGSAPEAEDEAEVTEAKRESSHASHASQRRHKKYRRRFPTLAQTGGLPPKRPFPEEPPAAPGSAAPT